MVNFRQKNAIDGGSPVATDGILVGMHGLSVHRRAGNQCRHKGTESQNLLMNKKRIKCHCFLYQTG